MSNIAMNPSDSIYPVLLMVYFALLPYYPSTISIILKSPPSYNVLSNASSFMHTKCNLSSPKYIHFCISPAPNLSVSPLLALHSNHNQGYKSTILSGVFNSISLTVSFLLSLKNSSINPGVSLFSSCTINSAMSLSNTSTGGFIHASPFFVAFRFPCGNLPIRIATSSTWARSFSTVS